MKIVTKGKPRADTGEGSAKAQSGKSVQTVKPKRKERAKTASIYKVHIYDAGVVKWSDKHNTRVLSVDNGMLVFEHKRPYSKLMIQEIIPLSQVIVYGHEELGDSGAPGWVYVRHPRTIVDSFTATAWKRRGQLIEFDLGDGLTTTVNAGADFEIVGLPAE